MLSKDFNEIIDRFVWISFIQISIPDEFGFFFNGLDVMFYDDPVIRIEDPPFIGVLISKRSSDHMMRCDNHSGFNVLAFQDPAENDRVLITPTNPPFKCFPIIGEFIS